MLFLSMIFSILSFILAHRFHQNAGNKANYDEH